MAVPASPGSVVGKSLGKYEILALLAVGGTAEIYLARIGGEAGFEKFVVVKCLHEHLAHEREFVDMFLDEARLGAQLDHSNIVQTLELGQHQGRYYMVMEYLAGLSLAQVARAAQDRLPSHLIPPEIVLGLAAQACAGLHYAHERSAGGTPLNVVHRDVSPQNLVISFDGVLKVVDFGIAKADVRRTRTETGTIKGKFAYMSPEQCMAKPLDRRTDIFALGTIVHELLTGQRLFKRGSTYETYQAILAGQVPSPSSINRSLDGDVDALVMKALAYEREERYPTAEAFGEALLGLLHKRGESVSASDVARFFDAHFATEIEAHGRQMREVIAGRRVAAVTGAWSIDGDSDAAAVAAAADDDDEPSAAGPSAVRGGAGKSKQTKDSAPTLLLGGPKSASARARGRGAPAGDFEDGGETQIELYPMGRLAATDADKGEQEQEQDDDSSERPTNRSLPRHSLATAATALAPLPPRGQRAKSVPPPPPGAPANARSRTNSGSRAGPGLKKTLMGTEAPRSPVAGPAIGAHPASATNGARPAPPLPPPAPAAAAPDAHTLYAAQAPALGTSPSAQVRAPSEGDAGAPAEILDLSTVYPRAVTFQPDAARDPGRGALLALLAIAFLISAGVGLGATMLVGALIG